MKRKIPFVCGRCKRQTKPAFFMCVFCATCERDFEEEINSYQRDDAKAEAAEDLFAQIARNKDFRPSGWGGDR